MNVTDTLIFRRNVAKLSGSTSQIGQKSSYIYYIDLKTGH